MVCVYREMLEESGLHVSSLEKVGVMIFEFVNEPELMEVHVFRTDQYEGEPIETEGKYSGGLNIQVDSMESIIVLSDVNYFWMANATEVNLVSGIQYKWWVNGRSRSARLLVGFEGYV